MKSLFLLIVVFLYGITNCYTFPEKENVSFKYSPAYPYSFSHDQKNGSTVLVRIIGDEYNNAVETIDGYTVIYN